jgi:hypothetical protein
MPALAFHPNYSYSEVFPSLALSIQLLSSGLQLLLLPMVLSAHELLSLYS